MSRFVSEGAGAENAAEKDAEWIKVQQELEVKMSRKIDAGTQEGGKSLYEVLQANKATKQDAFEESIRLKNQFRPLNDDEVEYLNSEQEKSRAYEASIQEDTIKQLGDFRKQREEAEKLSNAQRDQDDAAKVDNAMWTDKGTKRKKRNEKKPLLGMKMRKMSLAGDLHRPELIETASSSQKQADKPSVGDDRDSSPSQVALVDPLAPIVKVQAESHTDLPAFRAGTSLGLVSYSSDGSE